MGSQPLAKLEVDINVKLDELKRQLNSARSITYRHQSDWAKSWGKVGSEAAKAAGTIGKEFSRSITASMKAFAPAAKEIARSMGSIGKEATKTAGLLGKSFSDSFNSVVKATSLVTRDVTKLFGVMTKEASKSAQGVSKAFKGAISSGSGGGGIFSIGSGIVSAIISPIKSMGSMLLGTLSHVFTGVLQGLGQALFGVIQNLIITPIRSIKNTIFSAIADAGAAQTVNMKFKNVFEDLTKDAETFAENYAKKFGKGLMDVKTTLSRFQDTLVPVGFGVGQAADMSKILTRLSGDLSVSEGISEMEAADRIVSGMVGNHEALRRFGVIITETSLNAKLLAMGIKDGNKSATEQQKVMARLNILLDGTRQAQGSAAKGASNYETALRGMHSTYQDLSATLGRAFLPAATKILTFFKETYAKIRQSLGDVDKWGARLGDAVGNVIKMMEPFRDKFAEMIVNTRSFFDQLTQGLADGTSTWDIFKESIIKSWDLFTKGAAIAWESVKNYASQGFAFLAGGLAGLIGVSEESISSMIQKLFNGLGEIIAAIEVGIMSLVRSIPEAFGGGNSAILKNLDQDTLNTIFDKMGGKRKEGENKDFAQILAFDRMMKEGTIVKRPGYRGLDETLNAIMSEGGIAGERVKDAASKVKSNPMTEEGRASIVDRVMSGGKAALDGFNKSNPAKNFASAMAGLMNDFMGAKDNLNATLDAGGNKRRAAAFAREQMDRLRAQQEGKLAFAAGGVDASAGDEARIAKMIGNRQFRNIGERQRFIQMQEAKTVAREASEEKRLRAKLTRMNPDNADRFSEMSLAELRREQFDISGTRRFGASFKRLGIDNAKGVFSAMGMSLEEAKRNARNAGISLSDYAKGLGREVDNKAQAGNVDVANASEEVLQGLANDVSGRKGNFGRRGRFSRENMMRQISGSVQFGGLEDIGRNIQLAIDGKDKQSDPVVGAIDKLKEIAQKQFEFFQQNKRAAGPVGDFNTADPGLV